MAATNDKLLRVDMTKQTIKVEDFPKEWELLGGRGLSARILLNECDPKCDPLGPDNMLILAPGVMSGTAAPTSGRLSVGCKSPLTNGIKEANVGGDPGQHLVKLGYRAVIVSGQPADRERRYGLEITADGVEFKPADGEKGMLNYALCEKLLKNYPRTASVISIGPAGEMMLKGASVACTDKSRERHPARHAARGGVGAVMGSKGLKWIVVDPGKLPARQPARRKEFMEYCKRFSKDYLGQRHKLIEHGTSGVVPLANMLHTFPYKNRSAGRNPEAEKLDGARIHESFKTRGGGMHNCMTGCIVRCSNVVNDKDGNYLTSALEFETLALLGSNCDINSWEDVADMDRLCDEIGIDTIETGAAIGVLMDSGGMQWGDAEGVKKLIQSIPEKNETALDVANGALHVGTKRKHNKIPVAKGQALAAWEPRSVKAVGVTYCTSAMGGDHTAGFTLDPEQSDEAAVQDSQEAQINHMTCDSAGFCIFLQPSLDEIRTLYGHFIGRDVSREEIADISWQSLTEEWEFNKRAGFTPADDVLPEHIRNDGIGDNNEKVFQVSADLIAKAKVRQPARESLYTEGRI